jgi:hypothetical protein
MEKIQKSIEVDRPIRSVFLRLTIDKVAKMIFLARFGSGVIVCC